MHDRNSILIHCLHRAGEILLSAQRDGFAVSSKGDKSNIVSDADLAAERSILSGIQQFFPDDAVLSEECGFSPGRSGYSWIIDPLDGTSNFAARIPWFGSMIAVLQGTTVIHGGIFLPVDNRLYFASRGSGAFCNDAQVRACSAAQLSEVLCAYGIDCSDCSPAQLGEIGSLARHVRNLRCTNSLVDLSYVLDGRLGGCVNRSTKIWDIAAFSLLIEEAGGSISDPLGAPVVLEVSAAACERTFPIVAGGKHLHPLLIDLLRGE